MLKAVFLDLDQTLSDSDGATRQACQDLKIWLAEQYPAFDGELFTQRYVDGFFRRLQFPQLEHLSDDLTFRLALIQMLFAEQNIALNAEKVQQIQTQFDQLRMAALHFFPGIEAMLRRLRAKYTLVVITNGSSFSQRPKIAKLQLESFVDHILVGKEQPEEKPATSIFEKALMLAGCSAQEAIHVGDSFECDITGAHNTGIANIWVTQSEPSVPPASFATYVIHEPSAMEAVIEQHAASLQK
ncbi:MAG: HAD family hydrolase [Vibrionaceae bacterium]